MPILKITKKDILDVTCNIIEIEGIENVNTRKIASMLNCSVQPIFFNFKNMENLLAEALDSLKQRCFKLLLEGTLDSEKPYREIGLNYIKLAREKKNLFKLVFMSKSEFDPISLMVEDKSFFEKISNIIKIETQFKDDEVKEFHEMMWIFTHGIATLICSGTTNISDEDTKKLLQNQFIALMQLVKFKKDIKYDNNVKIEDMK